MADVLRNAAVGDALPSLSMPPVSRLTLALYCGASGDHNPLHVDQDFADAAPGGALITRPDADQARLGSTVTA